MVISNCTQNDFHEILKDISDFWGSDRTLHAHLSLFIHEFGDSAFVIKDNGKVIAYLFGFLSQTQKTGYIHLIGVRQHLQNKGLGKLLYGHFENYVRKRGCTKLKAITTPTNQLSIAFHKKIGMKLLGEKSEDGIEVVKDYSAPGEDRVVFEKEI